MNKYPSHNSRTNERREVRNHYKTGATTPEPKASRLARVFVSMNCVSKTEIGYQVVLASVGRNSIGIQVSASFKCELCGVDSCSHSLASKLFGETEAAKEEIILHYENDNYEMSQPEAVRQVCGCEIVYDDITNAASFQSHCERHAKPHICRCGTPLFITIAYRKGFVYPCKDCGREYSASSNGNITQSRLSNFLLNK